MLSLYECIYSKACLHIKKITLFMITFWPYVIGHLISKYAQWTCLMYKGLWYNVHRYTVQWTMYTVYNIQCTLCTIDNVHCIQSILCTLYNLHFVQSSMYTLYIIQCTIYNVHTVRCSLYTMYTLYNIQFTLLNKLIFFFRTLINHSHCRVEFLIDLNTYICLLTYLSLCVHE